MFYKLYGLGVLTLAVVGGIVLWRKYDTDEQAEGPGDDDYWAGLNFGITGWAPQLPIHPKSMAPTEAVYAPVAVTGKRGRPGRMTTARSVDWYNPAQLVPTTGPGNLAPLPGINTGWVNADAFGNPNDPFKADGGILQNG